MKTRRVDGRATIVVADRGAGIGPADLARIFDPFFTTKRGGTGLGLPIAKNIFEGLGGKFYFQRRDGNHKIVATSEGYDDAGNVLATSGPITVNVSFRGRHDGDAGMDAGDDHGNHDGGDDHGNHDGGDGHGGGDH